MKITKAQLKGIIKQIIEESNNPIVSNFESIIMPHLTYTKFRSKNKNLVYKPSKYGIDLYDNDQLIANYDMENEIFRFDVTNDIFNNSFVLSVMIDNVAPLLNANIISSLSESDKEKMITLLNELQSINNRL